jgi:hypothetical protein
MIPVVRLFITVLASCTIAFSVNVGETASSISLTTYGGGTFKLAQQQGKVTVIFFLGCT